MTPKPSPDTGWVQGLPADPGPPDARWVVLRAWDQVELYRTDSEPDAREKIKEIQALVHERYGDHAARWIWLVDRDEPTREGSF